MKNLELFLNRNCNFTCTYCSIRDNGADESAKSLDILTELIESEDISSAYILGGEPTINKNFIDIISLLDKNGITSNIFSNGTITNDTINGIINKKVRFILSYHRECDDMRGFIKRCLVISRNFECDIIVAWNGGSVDDFFYLKRFFDNVYIEPVFHIENGFMVKDNFKNLNDIGMLSHSKILNMVNRFSGRTFYDIFMSGVDTQTKECSIDDYNITFDFQTGKSYKCLTYLLSGIDDCGLMCDNTYCLCDLEYIK